MPDNDTKAKQHETLHAIYRILNDAFETLPEYHGRVSISEHAQCLRIRVDGRDIWCLVDAPDLKCHAGEPVAINPPIQDPYTAAGLILKATAKPCDTMKDLAERLSSPERETCANCAVLPRFEVLELARIFSDNACYDYRELYPHEYYPHDGPTPYAMARLVSPNEDGELREGIVYVEAKERSFVVETLESTGLMPLRSENGPRTMEFPSALAAKRYLEYLHDAATYYQ